MTLLSDRPSLVKCISKWIWAHGSILFAEYMLVIGVLKVIDAAHVYAAHAYAAQANAGELNDGTRSLLLALLAPTAFLLGWLFWDVNLKSAKFQVVNTLLMIIGILSVIGYLTFLRGSLYEDWSLVYFCFLVSGAYFHRSANRDP